MKKHIKNYLDNFGYYDFIPCEICGLRATDIHHVKYKSRGGTDEYNNLVALCRICHNLAHEELIKESDFKKIIDARN